MGSLEDSYGTVYVHLFFANYSAWNSRLTTRGRKLQKHIDMENYGIIKPARLTHYPTNGGQADGLDVFILHNTDIDYGH